MFMIANMELPTEKQLDKNYKAWKDYLTSLGKIVEVYENGPLLKKKLGEEWGKKTYPKSWKNISIWVSDFRYEEYKTEMNFGIEVSGEEYCFSVIHRHGDECEMTIEKSFFSPRNKQARKNLLTRVMNSLEEIYKVECRSEQHTQELIGEWEDLTRNGNR